MSDIDEAVKEIFTELKTVSNVWDARTCILEMKGNKFKHWKQMEWIGFYFQYLCEKRLGTFMKIPGSKYGNVSFDGFLTIPWDFKAHAINTSSHDLGNYPEYDYIDDIINKGQTILNYKRGINEELMIKSFDVMFEGVHFLAVNGGKGSDAFDSKFNPDKYDAMLSFSYLGNSNDWTISLYGNSSCKFDLSEIAKKYKGGGHKGAAGCRVNTEMMMKLLRGELK